MRFRDSFGLPFSRLQGNRCGNTHTHIQQHTHKKTHGNRHTHTQTHVYINTTHAHTNTHSRTYTIHTHARINTHTHIEIHIHAYVHNTHLHYFFTSGTMHRTEKGMSTQENAPSHIHTRETRTNPKDNHLHLHTHLRCTIAARKTTLHAYSHARPLCTLIRTPQNRYT